MRKIVLILTLCSVIAACGGNTKTTAGSDSSTAANQSAVAQQPQTDTSVNKTGTEPAASAASSAKGAQLMASSDCNSCHKEKDKLVGPAFSDIAHKYPSTDANISMLADKVIKGGKGNWGDVPMTPHPALAVNDAKEMVKYILSVK
jgi:cytochrome c